MCWAGVDTDCIESAVSVSRFPIDDGMLYEIPLAGNVEIFACRSDLKDRPESWTDVVATAMKV